MNNLEGQVAFITGAARGQGRSHAVRLAEAGADIVAIDICAPIDGVNYPLGTKEDLDETAKLVEAQGRRIVTAVADVREASQLAAAVEAGMNSFGRIDHLIANAGILTLSREEPTTPDARLLAWQRTLDVNLTGIWQSVEAVLPAIRHGGRGGSIVITSSVAGLRAITVNNLALTAYVASKTALVGLMRGWAKDLAPESIRVNTIHPTNAPTGMTQNSVIEYVASQNPGLADAFSNPLPIDEIQVEDLSAAVIYLCGASGRYVTGVTLSVDAGFNIK
jgi:SDR family mycofactocin-dependent oxidoreductase